MRLSVVICTRNRADQLQRTLQSISCCDFPPGNTWEIIVVDNGSSDHTAAVVASARNSLPLSSYTEPTPGLSRARNCAVLHANGDWMLWTDDDVTVSQTWLTTYYNAIAEFPCAAAFGGPILVRFDGAAPAWLERGVGHVRSAFAGLEPDDLGPMFSSTGRVPYGANFALRREYLLAQTFNPDLGRHPAHPLRAGEETPLLRHATRQGEGRWLADAAVKHHIDKHRQTSRYLRGYYFRYGARQASEQAETTDRLGVLRAGLRALKGAAYNELRLLRGHHQSELRALHLKEAARAWGQAAGAWCALLQRKAINQ